MQSPEKLVRFIPNAGNPFSRSEAKNSSPRLTPWAFLCLRSGQGSWVETCCTTRRHPPRKSPEPDCICRSLVITSGFQPEYAGSIPARCSNPSTLGPLRLPRRHFLPLVFLPALSGFFIEHAQTLGNHPRRALLINQPAGSGPLFPFTHSAIRHQRR